MQGFVVPSLFPLRPAGALALVLAAVQLPGHAAEGIVTDRPDFVESSNVVGFRRLQVETSVAVDRDRSASSRERMLATPTLLRYGVSDSLELRVETDGRIVARSRALPDGRETRESGYADVALGLKWHMADAQGALPSLGVLLHADTPSGSRALRGNRVRPSLRMVGEWELPGDMSLGVMPGIARDTDAGGERYVYGIFGAVLGKQLSEQLRGFVEIAVPHAARSGRGGTEASLDVGGAYLLTDTLQLDAMLSRGLNSRTPDLGFTVGLSFKL